MQKNCGIALKVHIKQYYDICISSRNIYVAKPLDLEM